MDPIKDAYSKPTGIFISAGRRQRGGGFFGRIARFAIPILKSIGQSFGKEAINFASNTLSDINQGKPVRETLKNRGINSLINASQDVIDKHKKKRKRNVFN